MNASKTYYFWAIFIFIIMAASFSHAITVNYTLENVILDDNNAQMFGDFSWIFDSGDFENGVGQFSYLDIPFTAHDHTDLDAIFDVGNSIEITFPGSVHDDGVDITLFLSQPLTPTTGSSINLARSRYEIGGNGFHTGYFLSGSIVLSVISGVEDGPRVSTAIYRLHPASPNPFNPTTTIAFDLPQQMTVSLRIFDVAGRQVNVLLENESASQGRHEFVWRGRDMAGRAVSAGVYFYSLETGGQVQTKRMTLLK
jgi:hypothetical protein